MRTAKFDQKNYKKTVEESRVFLNAGKTIIVPTDTIYGLSCDALNERAVENLYRIKERGRRMGLPVFVNSIEMARRLAYIDKKKEEFLRKIWLVPLGARTNGAAGTLGISPLTGQGKITVVLYVKDLIPRLATGGRETIALRMPNHPFIRDLIAALGKPITGTSANISGNDPIHSSSEAAKQWKNKKIAPALVVDGGEITNTEPSTIVDITGNFPIVLREGIIAKKELDKFFLKGY